MLNSEQILELTVNCLDDNKAIDIKALDVTSLTEITDHIVICTASSTRAASSIADKLVRHMREHDIRPLSVEGADQADWILVDLNDIVVHIMLADQREFYDLEKLWTVTEKARAKNEN